MRDARIAAALGLVSMLAGSCGRLGGFEVARANRLYRDGYAHEAAAIYLRAGAGRDPVASYNLANAFISLGEPGPARPLFDAAIGSGDVRIAAMSWYNIGAAAFESADYPVAAAAFRKGLEVLVDEAASDAGRGEAKRAVLGLELSRSMELALEAASRRREAGAVERGAYGAGRSGGEPQPFALSRTDERTLFAPGGSRSDASVDH